MNQDVLTIGHSTHSADAFLELLREQGAELLVDVRRHPGSRRVPWTKSEQLEQLLDAAEIGYVHLGSLGGRRSPSAGSPNGGWRVAQFQGYADHMASDEFLAGLQVLEGEARARRAVVMCAEAQWWRCHRRLLADLLTVRGWRVCHVDGRGRRQQHTITDFAEVRGGSLRYPSRGR
jgi:uncharacterized protein (DUF488 family)